VVQSMTERLNQANIRKLIREVIDYRRIEVLRSPLSTINCQLRECGSSGWARIL